MADAQRFENLSQSARESLVNSLRSQETDPSTYVDVTGDTMIGALAVPTIGVTSNASVSGSLTVGGAFVGSTFSFSSNSTGLGGLVLGSNVTLTNALVIKNTVLGGPTTAPIQLVASTASQAFFDFQGAVISTASLNLAANQMAGVIKVWINGVGGQNVGYLPIFKGVV
jgi:hypothetical protein